MLKDKRIGIVGGSGYLGGELARSLSEHNHVRIIDRQRPAFMSGQPNLSFACCDVTKEEDCLEALRDIDIVFHRAGLYGNLPSMKSPGLYHRVNVIGTLNVLRACVERQVEKLLFDSTEFVYGSEVSSPVTEEVPARPSSIYGASKLICETAIRTYNSLFGLRFIIFRFCRVRDKTTNDVIAVLTKKILAGEPITLMDGGNPAMDFVDLSDATNACIAAAAADVHNEIINVSCGECISLNAIVETIRAETKAPKARIVYRDINPKPPTAEYQFGPVKFYMAIGKAKSLLGWEPKIDLLRSVRETVKFQSVQGPGNT